MKSDAATVDDYLAGLPEDRRAAIAAVLERVRATMPDGYAESMSYGMICWSIPLARYPKTYNKQPLAVTALASQKNYCALHLTAVYSDPEREAILRDGFAAIGKKPDMGKGCIRFQKPDDLPLDAIGDLIAGLPVDDYIALYERIRAQSAKK